MVKTQKVAEGVGDICVDGQHFFVHQRGDFYLAFGHCPQGVLDGGKIGLNTVLAVYNCLVFSVLDISLVEIVGELLLIERQGNEVFQQLAHGFHVLGQILLLHVHKALGELVGHLVEVVGCVLLVLRGVFVFAFVEVL